MKTITRWLMVVIAMAAVGLLTGCRSAPAQRAGGQPPPSVHAPSDVPAGQPGTVQEKIRVLQRQIVDLETEQVTLRQKLNPSHPKVLDVMTRLDRLKKELASLTGEAP